jgi:hypothetical protein
MEGTTLGTALLTSHVDEVNELQPAFDVSIATEKVTDYERVIDQLIRNYAQIDRAAGLLPSVSIMPYAKLLWSVVKFEFAVIGDVILIIPINVIVLIRNIFPGRWRYKSFCWPYIKAAAQWFWMGECSIPFFHIRVLSVFFAALAFPYSSIDTPSRFAA